MGTTLWIISILSITNLTAGHSSLIQSNFDLVSYLRPLPEELRPKVRLALRAEEGKPLTIKECEKEEDSVPCPPSKYRSANGECNNVRHPSWGTRGAPFLRLMDPDYADGMYHVLLTYFLKALS